MESIRAGSAGALIAALLGVVLAGWAIHTGLQVRELRAEDHGRGDVVRAAEAEVIALISVNSKTTEADLEQLADGATGSFRSELEEQSKALRAALHGQQVTSTGGVASTGVVSWSPERARVIVAARGNVANKSAKGAQPRMYRLKVDLRNVEGRWLVSGLEFVA